MLVDDHKPVRDSLRQLIELADGFEVVGEGSNGTDAVRQVSEVSPDVVLMDVNMPGMSGVDATREIKGMHPDVKILALSALGDVAHVSSMIKAGANGYLMKGGPTHELLSAIRAVKHGEGPLDRGLTLDVIRSFGDLEDQLRQAQKMESVGQLVSGVAHDFNNLISIIQNYAQFASADLDESDPRLSDLHEIEVASERAAALVKQLLTFSRKDAVQPEIVDVNEAITRLERLWGALGEDIRVEIECDADLWHVRIDPGSLDQIIMNLAINARDAMPRGGVLRISTENVSVGRQLSQHHPGVLADKYVRLTMTDDGEGMSKDVMNRVFEPFFTTKPRDRGTGLGLATVYGIVKQVLGSIQVESEPDEGTTFRVFLPATDSTATAAAPVEPESEPGRGELVLVVEDEVAVRRVICRILSKGGYAVTSAGSVSEALQLLEETERPIEVLVVDVIMPGLASSVLVERLAQRDPGAKVLYVSGHSDQMLSRHGIDASSHRLQKPFNSHELLGRVKALSMGE